MHPNITDDTTNQAAAMKARRHGDSGALERYFSRQYFTWVEPWMSSITSEATLCLSKSSVYKDRLWFYSFWTRCKTLLRAPQYLPSLHQGLFLFFSASEKNKKKKEITDAVTLLLVLPLALMENVKGAQPRWGQADTACERWPSHKTDVYCFSRDDLLSAQYWPIVTLTAFGWVDGLTAFHVRWSGFIVNVGWISCLTHLYVHDSDKWLVHYLNRSQRKWSNGSHIG